MAYSLEFKNRLLSKLLIDGGPSVAQLSEQAGAGKSTLRDRLVREGERSGAFTEIVALLALLKKPRPSGAWTMMPDQGADEADGHHLD